MAIGFNEDKRNGNAVDIEKSGVFDSEKEKQDPKVEDDPWELPEFKDNTVPWNELTFWGKVWRVSWVIIRILLLLGALYMFICSLDFLGTAFKLLGGKTAGKAFSQHNLLSNPIAGLVIGVLVTVLVQSSSTSTSIIITMVGAGLLQVGQAVYIVMGANIGTTVTNTIVSLGQAKERNEFRRAFGAATVHDMFNWLTVLILLPLEAASGMLQKLTWAIVKSMHLESNEGADKDFLQVITKPFTKLIIKINKHVIEEVAQAKTKAEKEEALAKDIHVTFCKTGPLHNVTKEVESMVNCSTVAMGTTVSDMVTSAGTTEETKCFVMENVTVLEKSLVRCHTLFAQGSGDFKLSDAAAGAILLIVAIGLLCLCLFLIVKILHSMLEGHISKIIRKFLNNDFPGYLSWLTGYVALLIGAGLTILVQSSSIFTSALTPLVGVGILKLERMYPLTLGSNIGTTTTGIMAALAADSSDIAHTLQLAFCHLFFNIIGIAIWYPIPFMRKAPLSLAKFLGNTTANYRWFAIAYLFGMFFIMPAAVFGLSLAGWQVLAGIGIPIILLFIVIAIIKVLQAKKPMWLPAKLRNWKWLPEPLRSLRPYDNLFRRCRCACCQSLCDDEVPETGGPHIIELNKADGADSGQDNPAFENKVYPL